MYIASLMALAILHPSLPMFLKFSTDVVWPVMLPSNVLYISLQKFQMIPLYIHPHNQSCHT